MIKRRFYKHDHGDRDVPSDSSSSSDSELDAEASVDTEEEEEDDVAGAVGEKEINQPSSSSSGYESEDSSANEVNLDSSGLPSNDDGSGGENYKQDLSDTRLFYENDSEVINANNTKADSDNDPIPSDVLDNVLKSKSVFKCKLCPRIVCLTKETLKAHLKSKRHSRSEKLLREGRLKLMLNSDGEIEGETYQERHASTLVLAQEKTKADTSKKNNGRQRQRKRLRKKAAEDLTSGSTKPPAKKRRKRNI